MERLAREFEDIKRLLALEAAPVLGEAKTAAFVKALQDYQDVLSRVLAGEAQKAQEMRRENELLRELLGRDDTALQARVVELGTEAQFLRDQIVGLRKQLAAKQDENDGLRFKLEEKKNELVKSFNARQQEGAQYDEKLHKLNAQLMKLHQKTVAHETAAEEAKKRLQEKMQSSDEDARRYVAGEYKELMDRLRERIIALESRAGFCAERFKKPAHGAEWMAANAKDVESILENARKAATLFETHVQLHLERAPEKTMVNWQKLFKYLKAKYTPRLVEQKVRAGWPSEKRINALVADESIISDILGLMIENAVERVGPGGRFEISALRENNALIFRCTDTGPAVSPGAREKMFEPAPGTGLGQPELRVRAMARLARLAGGGIRYGYYDKGAAFEAVLPE